MNEKEKMLNGLWHSPSEEKTLKGFNYDNKENKYI